MKIRYWLFLLLILSFAAPAQAQTAVDRLARVQVDVWPDLDQPAVLVLITAELPDPVVYPASVTLSLPAAAGSPTAVARITADGQMLNTPFETESRGGVNAVVIETTDPVVRVEFYFPYQRDGDNVQLEYNWLGGAATDDLTILFREPLQAINVVTPEGFADIGIAADGQRFHQWSLGPVEAGETFSAAFSYTAPAAAVSAPVQAQPVAAPAGQPAQSLDALTIGLIAAGGSLVGAGLGWFFSARRTPAPVVVRRPGRDDGAAAFCHQCGAAVRSGDDFCRKCGTKIR